MFSPQWCTCLGIAAEHIRNSGAISLSEERLNLHQCLIGGRNGDGTTSSGSLPLSGLYGWIARRKLLLKTQHVIVFNLFWHSKHGKDGAVAQLKLCWIFRFTSYERHKTNTSLCLEYAISVGKPGGGSIMLLVFWEQGSWLELKRRWMNPVSFSFYFKILNPVCCIKSIYVCHFKKCKGCEYFWYFRKMLCYESWGKIKEKAGEFWFGDLVICWNSFKTSLPLYLCRGCRAKALPWLCERFKGRLCA